MNEQELIARFFAGRQPPRVDVRLGIGDDAAIVQPPPGHSLLIATDCIVAGTHFPPGTSAEAIGHRALAVNLSDMAAMGATPLWFTLALALPSADADWLAAFADGMFSLASRYDVALVGGDTVRGPLSATVTIVGHDRGGRSPRRSGARPGDGIWITGHPGDAVAGRLTPDRAAGPADAIRELRQRFLFPEPRVREGIALAPHASAMLDVSDGLHVDVVRLMAASGVGAELDAGLLPLSGALRACMRERAIECALSGGDDYELCFALPPEHEAAVTELAQAWPVPVTRIGTVVAGSGVRWLRDGKPMDVPGKGFEHF